MLNEGSLQPPRFVYFFWVGLPGQIPAVEKYATADSKDHVLDVSENPGSIYLFILV